MVTCGVENSQSSSIVVIPSEMPEARLSFMKQVTTVINSVQRSVVLAIHYFICNPYTNLVLWRKPRPDKKHLQSSRISDLRIFDDYSATFRYFCFKREASNRNAKKRERRQQPWNVRKSSLLYSGARELNYGRARAHGPEQRSGGGDNGCYRAPSPDSRAECYARVARSTWNDVCPTAATAML